MNIRERVRKIRRELGPVRMDAQELASVPGPQQKAAQDALGELMSLQNAFFLLQQQIEELGRTADLGT